MREDVPSRTAAWVAMMRGAADFLPARRRLVDDPYGFRFWWRLRKLRDDRRLTLAARATAPVWLRGRLRQTVLHMQVRTRVIDDDVDAFVRAGGRQIVLLGAGFDCRAWRLPGLADVAVFEVDHPATQSRKRAVMKSETANGRVVFVPWNFEQEPLDRLPARLGLDGHDRTAPTLTISEGVLPYLTDDAVEATFACVARYSSAGSKFTFTYFDRSLLTDDGAEPRRERLFVRVIGEPFRHGFEPNRLPGWLDARGYRLVRDESAHDLAVRMFPGDARAIEALSSSFRARRRIASASLK